MEEKAPPKVFVSYSHDSPDHKRWVSELCTRLRRDGIDIILDQWDLSLGDDITKFMEDGLALSDRVLLICTDNYVRKAEAGVGGVAYERMIVTAELIRDLGTQKFIPVVRQGTKEPILPKFLGARFYVNLGKEEDFEALYEILLRELHKERAIRKPPLGSSPFGKSPSGAEVSPAPDKITSASPLDLGKKDVVEIYGEALEMARTGDIVSWRRLVKEVRSKLPKALQRWREERKLDETRDKRALPHIMDEAVSFYAPLFAVALAGIQSGREKFRDQRAVIDELSRPSGWVIGGNTAIVSIPCGLIYIFQALHGAICLDTDQLELATQLALTRISNWYEPEPVELISSHDLVGWPDSLGGDCDLSWDYITKAAQRWPWLSKIFSIEDDYQVSLIEYYMVLSILELVRDIKEGKGDRLESGNEIIFDVPVSFLYSKESTVIAACNRLLRHNPRAIWDSFGVSLNEMKKYWPIWVKHSASWPSHGSHIWAKVPTIYQGLLLNI